PWSQASHSEVPSLFLSPLASSLLMLRRLEGRETFLHLRAFDGFSGLRLFRLLLRGQGCGCTAGRCAEIEVDRPANHPVDAQPLVRRGRRDGAMEFRRDADQEGA